MGIPRTLRSPKFPLEATLMVPITYFLHFTDEAMEIQKFKSKTTWDLNPARWLQILWSFTYTIFLVCSLKYTLSPGYSYFPGWLGHTILKLFCSETLSSFSISQFQDGWIYIQLPAYLLCKHTYREREKKKRVLGYKSTEMVSLIILFYRIEVLMLTSQKPLLNRRNLGKWSVVKHF